MGFFAPLLAIGKTLFAKKAVQQIGTSLAVSAFQAAQQRKSNAAAQSYAQGALDEQRVYDRDTLLRVREDAEKAGFNPLTALRNGASNIGANTYLQAPALSSNDFVGQALMQAIDTGFNAPQRELDAETQRLQNDLYRAQIGELQANTQYLSRSHGFGVPAVEQYGVSSDETSGPSLTRLDPLASGSVYDGNPAGVDGSRALATPIGWWRTDSSWAPTQAVEDEQGDLVSWPYGAAKLSWEAGLTARELAIKPLYYKWLETSSRSRYATPSYEIDGSFVP